MTGPLLLSSTIGAYHWFLRDDWAFLATRAGASLTCSSPTAAPTGRRARGHLLGLWQLFGVTDLPAVPGCRADAPGLAVLLQCGHATGGRSGWLASRRPRVRPGRPGAVNTVWAFQMASTAPRLGPWSPPPGRPRRSSDRRDLLGLVCGLLAITSSAVGVTLTVGVAVAVLLRRGWTMALLHGGPLLAIT